MNKISYPRRYLQRGILLNIFFTLLFSPLMAQDAAPVLTPGLAKTPAGNFFVYYRTPASAEDLGLPIPEGGEVLDSLVYRVRDRERRDLLFLARLRMNSPLSAQQALAIFLPAMGEEVTRENDAASGEISLAAGVADDLRLVIITPRTGGTTLRLERLQKFTLPPRIFNDAEQQVVKLLAQVAGYYRHVQEISYAVEQQEMPEVIKLADFPDPLNWKIKFNPPAEINLTATSVGIEGLRITTKDNQLYVKRQIGEEEIREIGASLTLDMIPELADDPVSGMVLGESLINPLLGELKMEKITTPKGEQAKITLQYPDAGEVLTLLVDMATRQVISAETVTTEEEHSIKIVRRYRDYKVKK